MVEDANELAPVFDMERYSGSALEEQTPGQFVLRVRTEGEKEGGREGVREGGREGGRRGREGGSEGGRNGRRKERR